VTAMSALSNTPQRNVYNYARRPILRTGLRPVQLFLVFIDFGLLRSPSYKISYLLAEER